MSNRKQTQIEINSSELMPKNQPGETADDNCVACQSRVQMLTPEQASAFTGIASPTIHRWIEDKLLHSQKSDEGGLLICLSSLRETYANSIKETKKVRAISKDAFTLGENTMGKDKICIVLLVMVVLLQAIVPAQQGKTPNVGQSPLKDTDITKFKAAPPAKTFEARYFAPTNTKLEPLPTIPFTADEFIKVAPPGIVTGSGSQAQVTVTRLIKNKYVLVKVPLDQYVAEVNKYEVFLNKLGYSLRDGKLNKSNPNDTQIQRDLGAILKLRDRKDVENDFNKSLDEIILDPNPLNIFKPHELKLRDGGNIKMNPADRRADSRSQTSGTKSPMIVAGDLPKGGEFKIDPNVISKSGAGFRMVRQSTNPLTGLRRVYKVSEGDVPPCDPPPPPKPTGGPRLIPVCPDKKCPENSSGENHSEDVQEGQFCGQEKTSGDPKCLFDGVMNTGPVSVLSATNSAVGAGGWFGAFTSVDLITRIKQEGTTLGISNLGKASAGITVLGFDLKVLTAKSEAVYLSTANPAYPPPNSELVAHLPTGEVPLTSKKEFHIPLFQTVFMAGPVPITISSHMDLSMGLQNSQQPFTPPPLACGTDKKGEMNMFLGGNVYAAVSLEAAVDAVVASAGLEARLVLVNDSFGANLKTEVTPGTNTVQVTPSMQLTLQHLEGKVFLFVELDLLLYSKRWSLTIFDSGDINPPYTTTYPKNPKTYTLASKKKG